MINRKIEVEYVIRKDDRTVGFEYEDIAKAGETTWTIDAIERTHTFNNFTNSGKLSKSEKTFRKMPNDFQEAIYAKAEEMFQAQMEIENDREADLARALELKQIIDNADFSSEMVTIKTKTSHSNWYKGGEGQMHMPSLYHTQVPKTVEAEALELQVIRKKHQNDTEFPFSDTSYRTVEIREADHDNYTEIEEF